MSGPLPGGRTVNGAAKTVTGAYTTAGTFNYVLRATDAVGATADLSVSMTVAASGVAAPVNTVAPTISGTSQVGQTLTGSDGTWTGPPTYARRWYRDGVAIGAATGSTYVVQPADLDAVLTFGVVGTNGSGSTTATSAGTSAVTAVATSLRTVSTAPYLAIGTRRMFSGYSGAAVSAAKSTGETQDIGFRSASDGARLDEAALATLGSNLGTAAVYDQTGNGRHFSQATFANMPSLGGGNKFRKCTPISIDGVMSGNAKTLTALGLSLDRIAVTIFMVVNPMTSTNTHGFFDMHDSGATTSYLNCYTNGRSSNLRFLGNSSQIAVSVPRAQMDILGYIGAGNIGTSKVHLAGAVASPTGSTMTTQVATGMTLGKLIAGSQYNGRYDLMGMVIYPAALSATDASNIASDLKAIYGVQTVFTKRLLIVGDSINEQMGATKNRGWLAQVAIDDDVEIYNVAVAG